MGYTHYWTQKRPATPAEWKNITISFRQLIQDTKPPIQYEYDTAKPVLINKDHIRFNGIGDDGHETMHVVRGVRAFNFCKTARKPYDRWVVALLLIMDREAPGCWEISSDGERDGEWAEVLKWLNGRGLGEFKPPAGVT